MGCRVSASLTHLANPRCAGPNACPASARSFGTLELAETIRFFPCFRQTGFTNSVQERGQGVRTSRTGSAARAATHESRRVIAQSADCARRPRGLHGARRRRQSRTAVADESRARSMGWSLFGLKKRTSAPVRRASSAKSRLNSQSRRLLPSPPFDNSTKTRFSSDLTNASKRREVAGASFQSPIVTERFLLAQRSREELLGRNQGATRPRRELADLLRGKEVQELRQSLGRDLSSDFGADAVEIPESPICLLVDEFLGTRTDRIAGDEQEGNAAPDSPAPS